MSLERGATAGSLGETARKLRFAFLFTLAVFVAEIVGGIWSGSLALVSDALHVLFDASALALSLFALHLGARPPTERRTYGLHRVEVFAAVANGLTLLVAAAFILREAYGRFGATGQIKAGGMTVIAAVGLVANAVVLLKLRPARGRAHKPRDLNLHSALLHVASDLLASVGVVAGGVLMWALGPSWAIVDPILAVAIGLLIVVGAGRVLYEAGHILLEGVPRGINVERVAETICGVPAVKSVHHLHVWSICSNLNILSAHVVVEEADLAKHTEILACINRVLAKSFHITDTTLQLETATELDDQLVKGLEHPAERLDHESHRH